MNLKLKWHTTGVHLSTIPILRSGYKLTNILTILFYTILTREFENSNQNHLLSHHIYTIYGNVS